MYMMLKASDFGAFLIWDFQIRHVQSVFCYCSKITDKLVYRKKVFFDSQFGTFPSMVSWPCCFWTCSKIVHDRGSRQQRKLLIPWQSGSREEGAKVPISPSRTLFPMTLLSPRRSHCLKVLSPPKIMPWAEYQTISTRAFEGHFQSKHSRCLTSKIYTNIPKSEKLRNFKYF